MAILRGMFSELSRACSVRALLVQLSERIDEAANCRCSRLYLVDPIRNELRCRVSSDSNAYELRLPINKGIHGRVLESRNAQTAQPNDAVSAILVTPVFAHSARGEHQEAPEIVAVLEVSQRCDGQPFTAKHQEFLAAIAAEVALVLAHICLDDSRLAPERITSLVGSSTAMQTLYDQIEEAATSRVPILLAGANGTGRARIAHAIHDLGMRADAPFVSLSCHRDHAFLESELFGDDGGGAGAIDRASGGTLLIEQAEHLGANAQHALLSRCGDRNTRLLCTMPADRGLEHSPGRDLQPSLALLLRDSTLEVPTLAERGPDDVAMLARFFVRLNSRALATRPMEIDPDAIAHLRAQRWPGNVQELANCIQNAVLCCEDNRIQESHVNFHQAPPGRQPSDSIPSGLLLAEAEERYILRTLDENSENRTRTASSLGIGRNTLVRKIKQYQNK